MRQKALLGFMLAWGLLLVSGRLLAHHSAAGLLFEGGRGGDERECEGMADGESAPGAGV